MSRHRCTVKPADCRPVEVVEVADGEVLLDSIARLVHKPVPLGCRRGGCGVCRVHIVSGSDTTGRMSRRHVSTSEEAEGYALACRVVPTSTLEVHPAPKPVRLPF